MPWSVLLGPFLGGFLFLNICYYSRFRHQRLDNNRFLTECAVAGVVLAGLAAPVKAALTHPVEFDRFVWAHYGPVLVVMLIVGGAAGWLYFSKIHPPMALDDESKLRLWRERLVKTSVAFLALPLLAGLILLACAHPSELGEAVAMWKGAVKFEYSGLAAIAMMLSVVSAYLLNFLADKRNATMFAVEQAGDYIISLCHKTVQNEWEIVLILANKSAYRGFISLSPNLKADSHLAILPTRRGILEKDSIQIKWEADYRPHLAAAMRTERVEGESVKERLQDFVVAIPTRLIEHAHVFRPELDGGPEISIVQSYRNRS